uniref:DUF5641 domain-containing protein n=1 Tax=Lygus hesperus TaxID=30085 RepID=A0A146M774_LYGHE
MSVSPDVALRRTWRAAQQLSDHFWNRLVREYLPTLARKTKWFEATRPLHVGDIVIVAYPSGPRNYWPKAVVTNVFPDNLGNVRTVNVRTADGVFRRPATIGSAPSSYKLRPKINLKI